MVRHSIVTGRSYEVATLMLRVLHFFHRYIPDILMMLQGVYIFWAFVCRRKVFLIVFGRRKVEKMDRVRTRVYT